MKYECIEKEKYKLHFIKTDKFKTIGIRIDFKGTLTEEAITEREILSGVLSNSTKDCPTLRDIIMKKEELYQLGYDCSSLVSGNYLLFRAETRFIDEKYTEKGMNETSIRFFLDSLFKPNIEGNHFKEETFLLEKRNYLEYLEGKEDDPDRYASIRFDQIRGKNSSLAFDKSGNIEILKKLDSKKLYEVYQNMIKQDILNIFIVGNIDSEVFTNIFDDYLQNHHTSLKNGSHYVEYPKKELEEVTETRNFTQSKLKMGYHVEGITEFERQYVLPCYNFILGGSVDSLLFKNVREKHSLCYDVHSSSSPIYGAVVIHAGIEAKDYEKTVSLIKENIEAMKKGEFDASELDKVKINYKASFKELFDNPFSSMNLYESHEYLGYDLLEERIQNMDKITKEMVIELACKVKLDTIYFLEGKDIHA